MANVIVSIDKCHCLRINLCFVNEALNPLTMDKGLSGYMALRTVLEYLYLGREDAQLHRDGITKF